MVAVDLKTNQVVKTIRFPGNVALSTTYLNDVRFDLTRGKAGVAYITDSGGEGPNGIIVVDLDSGHSWRKLSGHASVRADPNFRAVMPGDPLVMQPLMNRPVAGTAAPMTMGADGIALSNDGKKLYFCPLSSQRLYSVSTDALLDPTLTDDQVAATLHQLGRDYASDGLEADAAGDLYLTDYQNNAIHLRTHDDKDTIIVQDPRMIWPDTMCVANDGYLYFTANQLDRQMRFNEGQDLRQKPYYLFRAKIDARPVSLGPATRAE
jgi:sugar lactone lactonase YvrE